ncbi:hypothetical protein D9613_004585 [Agrocybe pediades]|uniref:DUF6534 domain-containing protein n=1 Tax=Agrocybe pediades TaxID=84607 RepID=A0A8H4QID3_9AGAR|nr:hypothetical protein D9613_004585 [Agrocybe pediades]
MTGEGTAQAILTFLAQCFFARRIFKLSKRNYYLASPILALSVLRLGAATASAGEMLKLRSYALFREQFRWLFSVGLGLSSAVDILTTVSLLLLLRRSRRQSLSMNEIIDELILYTLEIGSLTSLATVVSLVCWLTLENNLVFLGIHFVIGKLYANSLLATLNTRLEIGKNRVSAHNLMDLDVIRNAQGLQFFTPQVNAQPDSRPSTGRKSVHKSDGDFANLGFS